VNTYPAATTEFLDVTVTVDGQPVTDYEVAVTPYATPSTAVTDWQTPAQLDDQHGVIITGLQPGVYAVWTKVTDNPETVVQRNGLIEVTP
jgi:hypothetical protein